MLKKVLYVSVIMLLLAATYSVVANRVQAQSVCHFKILGHGVDRSEALFVYVLVGDGVYVPNSSVRWARLKPNQLPPVPATSLVFFNGRFALTESGEGWRENFPFGGWRSIGYIPSLGHSGTVDNPTQR